MNGGERIDAVIVTYNRKTLVSQTITALKMQTRPIDRIIIVDNASTDGTPELLKGIGALDDEQVSYVRLPQNTGGAGGFNAGMREGLADGADWIWIMDDDVAPAPTCLEEMLKYRELSECIHPRKYFPDGTEFMSERYFDILTSHDYAASNPSFRNGKKIIFTNTATFEGMLVSKRVLECAGLPDPKYFICLDDMLFAIRASTFTNISHVRDAIIYKLVGPSEFSPWKEYYLLRNRFYLFRDACEYLAIKPYFSERVNFIVLRILEVFRLLFRGVGHFRYACLGFVAGWMYLARRERDK